MLDEFGQNCLLTKFKKGFSICVNYNCNRFPLYTRSICSS